MMGMSRRHGKRTIVDALNGYIGDDPMFRHLFLHDAHFHAAAMSAAIRAVEGGRSTITAEDVLSEYKGLAKAHDPLNF